MRVAVVFFTDKGRELAERIKVIFQADILEKDSLEKAFSSYDLIVFVSSLGIAVRMVGPLLRDKKKDPGVVVLDDGGRFAISLSGGHWGGANRAAYIIASHIGAQPVVTTSSDVHGIPPVDLLGKRFGWVLENPKDVARVARDIVDGKRVCIFRECGEWLWEWELFPGNVVFSKTFKGFSSAIVVSDRIFNVGIPALFYRPKTLVVGLGLHDGTTLEEVEGAIRDVFSRFSLSPLSIKRVVTISRRKGSIPEEVMGITVEFLDEKEIKKISSVSPSKAFLHLGLPGVSEPCALFYGDELVVPKTVSSWVTVAVAREVPRGKLYIVGIGPGSLEHLTFKARNILRSVDVVVGYKRYVERVGKLLGGKRVISYGMGEELKRVEEAVELVKSGLKVALVSGGDPGIYGMSGAFFEFMAEKEITIDVEVVPGVPAHAAASSILGSPLLDFTCISLSDYLVPWEEIEKNLYLAASGTTVIVLYNPSSSKRKRLFLKALEIIESIRGDVFCAAVKNASREGEEVFVGRLRDLKNLPIDMNTIVFVGTGKTKVLDKKLITPRGYSNKG